MASVTRVFIEPGEGRECVRVCERVVTWCITKGDKALSFKQIRLCTCCVCEGQVRIHDEQLLALEIFHKLLDLLGLGYG